MIINLSRIDFGGVATGGGNAKPEERFNVQPTTAEQTITPTAGSVFSGGTVHAVTAEIDANIASNNIKEGVTILGVAGTLKEEKSEESFNVQPTTTEQTITPTAGSVFSGGTVHAVTSSIDSNIQPGNIKQGVAILGVAGTLSEGITPAGTIAINLNGTYDVTNYASAEVNVGDTPDYRYAKGTVDKEGLRAIGWTDEDILTYEQNIPPHFTWQNDQFKVSDENKALYLLDDPNPSSYMNNPNVTFVPKKNMESYFAQSSAFRDMKYIKGISFYDTSNMTDAYCMFYDCSSLTTIPQLNTSNVNIMDSMFSNCFNLITIPLLDTSKVTNMSAMFYNCSSLITIPLLDTSNVTEVSRIFNGCTNLTTIPLLNTSNVTNIASAFYGCSNLTTIPQLNTSNATNMNNMFNDCRRLITIPQLNTSKVTDMSYMFYNCFALTTIPQLDTSKVTNMNFMFQQSGVKTIPQLDTSKVRNMQSMFNYCDLDVVEGIDFSSLDPDGSAIFGWSSETPTITRFIVNGKINISMGKYSISSLTAIDYDSVKSILAAADRTDNTDAKTLTFNRTMTDQNGELASLVASCTSKGWTISGLTLQ